MATRHCGDFSYTMFPNFKSNLYNPVLTVSPCFEVCFWAHCAVLVHDSPLSYRCRSTGPGMADRLLRWTGPEQSPAAPAQSPGSGEGQRGTELPPSLRQVGANMRPAKTP